MWPNLNAPHSGWPKRDQPAPLVAKVATSAQPTGLSGQPSARAIGSHIAITTGDSTMDGASPTTLRAAPAAPPFSAQRSLSTSTSSDDAGDHTVRSWRPARIDSIDSAEPSASSSTWMGLPERVRGAVRWKASAESVRKDFFSEP